MQKIYINNIDMRDIPVDPDFALIVPFVAALIAIFKGFAFVTFFIP